MEKEICQYIEIGNTFERACRLVGISDRAFTDWRQRGEGTHPTRSKTPRYERFVLAVKAAEEKFKAVTVALILREANNGTWQAAAWLLERKYPEEFGRREIIAVEGHGLHVFHHALKPEEVEDLDIVEIGGSIEALPEPGDGGEGSNGGNGSSEQTKGE